MNKDKITIEVMYYQDMWQIIKDVTMTTIGKDSGVYPTSEWKSRLLRSGHSPIRNGFFIIRLHNIPSYVSTHLVRHHIGIEKFVSTRRTDRVKDNEVTTRDTPVDMVININFQAIINISKVRLCNGASKETIEIWKMVLESIKKYEPELYNLCVPTCISSGYCPEMFGCGYDKTKDFIIQLRNYRDVY